MGGAHPNSPNSGVRPRKSGMRFKGTTILFILFVILGGYVYLTEIRGKEERQKQEEAKKKVFQVEQKDISEISLVYPDRTIAGQKGRKAVVNHLSGGPLG